MLDRPRLLAADPVTVLAAVSDQFWTDQLRSTPNTMNFSDDLSGGDGCGGNWTPAANISGQNSEHTNTAVALRPVG